SYLPPSRRVMQMQNFLSFCIAITLTAVYYIVNVQRDGEATAGACPAAANGRTTPPAAPCQSETEVS
ncbi:MAG: hypothetical protein JXN61_00765, partial [Sedimentisphaerales bacterium]|nr:hypothetical protein [Sedimentisphaerales bacterium]